VCQVIDRDGAGEAAKGHHHGKDDGPRVRLAAGFRRLGHVGTVADPAVATSNHGNDRYQIAADEGGPLGSGGRPSRSISGKLPVMDRVGRGLLPYGVVVAEYLLAAAVFVPAMRAAISAQPQEEMIGGNFALLLTALIAGVIALVVGLPVSLAILRRRTQSMYKQPASGPAWVVVVSKAAATGLLWGLLGAIPLTGCVIAAGNHLFPVPPAAH
jgi:hypothetical protein